MVNVSRRVRQRQPILGWSLSAEIGRICRIDGWSAARLRERRPQRVQHDLARQRKWSYVRQTDS